MNITQEVFDDNLVIRLEGRLDAVAVRDNRDALAAIADPMSHWLILNLQGVDFIDSSGLGLIVSLVKRARQRDADLVICNLTPQVQSLFELTRMTRIFSIHTTEADALAAVK